MTNPARSDLVGQRFNRLVVTADLGWKGKNKQVRCTCDCGNETTPYIHALRSGHVKSCGCWKKEIVSRVCSARVGPKHHNWRGGRRIVAGGYVRIKMPDHPRADSRGYVLEHIVVMEEKIGRELLPGETVHHIYGVRDDNRSEKLELWDTNHCAGQRHIEKMAFHTQEIVAKAFDDELALIARAILKRMQERGISLAW